MKRSSPDFRLPTSGMINGLFLISCFALLINGCSVVEEKKPSGRNFLKNELSKQNEEMVDSLPEFSATELEQRLKNEGLIDIREVDSSFVVDLRYSSENNFLEKDVYGDFEKAYLQPDVAEKLKLAQNFLRGKYPAYSLLIYDAVRPRHIQLKMWKALDLPVREKTKYLSNPRNGSLHNFGAAVDVTIVDEFREELDMGTDFDFFGELAYPRHEERLLKEGVLKEEQVENRQLLREVMGNAGFFGIPTEWWHFNSCTRKEARMKYTIIE